jgi:hypothetical protein
VSWSEETELTHFRGSVPPNDDSRRHDAYRLRKQISSGCGRLLAQQAIGSLAILACLRQLSAMAARQRNGRRGRLNEMDMGLDRGALHQQARQQ